MDKISDAASNAPTAINGIVVRPTRLEDLKQINDLLARVQFDVGVHILELYYLNSDRRWYVAVNEKGEIVAFDSSHILPVYKVIFGFDMYVSDEYQNRGIIRRIGSVYAPGPGMGNATPEAMLYFPQMQKYDTKLLGYVGRPDLSLLDNGFEQFRAFAPFRVSVSENEVDMEQVLIYDRSVLDLDRSQFMRAWCTKSKPNQPYARTLMARREPDGNVVGFGTLRLYSDFYAISPLYADDQTVTRRLLVELVQLLLKDRGEAYLYVFFDAKNHLMMEFVHRLKFEQCECEMREYGKGAAVIKQHIRFERVYALHDYWPV